MREIKFRLWNNAGDMSRMFYDVKNVSECLKQQMCFDDRAETHSLGYDHIGDGSVFMQYTGLKDKNGKEIYESDILTNKKSSKSNFFVKFNVGGYDAVYKGNFTLCLHPVLGEYDGCEIIGNIYENPELL